MTFTLGFVKEQLAQTLLRGGEMVTHASHHTFFPCCTRKVG